MSGSVEECVKVLKDVWSVEECVEERLEMLLKSVRKC